MSLIKKIVLLSTVLCSTCADTQLKIVDAQCGSNVQLDGTIANASLHYTFKPCIYCTSCNDISNYIYFQGDTLCFSVQCNKNITASTVTAYFENPTTHATYKAERIEKIKKRVWGFSLIGSLIENLYRKQWDCKNLHSMKLPFIIHITIALQNQKAEIAVSNTMYIQFASEQ